MIYEENRVLQYQLRKETLKKNNYISFLYQLDTNFYNKTSIFLYKLFQNQDLSEKIKSIRPQILKSLNLCTGNKYTAISEADESYLLEVIDERKSIPNFAAHPEQ